MYRVYRVYRVSSTNTSLPLFLVLRVALLLLPLLKVPEMSALENLVSDAQDLVAAVAAVAPKKQQRRSSVHAGAGSGKKRGAGGGDLHVSEAEYASYGAKGNAAAVDRSVMVEEVRREVVPCLNISVCGATGGPMCLLGLLEYTEIILASMCEHS